MIPIWGSIYSIIYVYIYIYIFVVLQSISEKVSGNSSSEDGFELKVVSEVGSEPRARAQQVLAHMPFFHEPERCLVYYISLATKRQPSHVDHMHLQTSMFYPPDLRIDEPWALEGMRHYVVRPGVSLAFMGVLKSWI